MEHTKGPWRIDGGVNDKGDLFIWKDGEYYGGHAIATIHGEIEEGARGNARLIAAAPDLLEACKDALEGYRHICRLCDTTLPTPCKCKWQPQKDNLEKAIAKATS